MMTCLYLYQSAILVARVIGGAIISIGGHDGMGNVVDSLDALIDGVKKAVKRAPPPLEGGGNA